MLEFPAASFEVDGEPEAIRETSRSYGRFATTTGQASSDIRSLNSGEWVGTEGELFRAGISHLPPHYDTAHTAFGQVSQALSGFATELDTMKSQMRTLRTEAEQTFASLKSAQQARSDLKEPSGDHDSSAKSAYEQQKNSLDGRISGLESTWQQHLTNATHLRDQAQQAAGRAGQAIRAAGRTSPTADQNWLERNLEAASNWISDRIDDIKNFVKEHAGIFRGIATALKWVGGALMAAAGIAMVVAAFVPVLGWLAELPLGAIFLTGSALFGAGEVLDTTVDWAEGKISGTELLIRAGVAVVLSIVGAGAAKLVGKGLEKISPKLQRWYDDLFGRKGEEPKRPPKDNGRWGPLEKVNKPDPQADRLADKLEGESRVKFKNDPKGREYDAVSDDYVAQTKPANFTLNKRFREQTRATFEVARDTDRRPYFHFEGPPGKGVVETINRYAKEYGIDPVIDISPL